VSVCQPTAALAGVLDLVYRLLLLSNRFLQQFLDHHGLAAIVDDLKLLQDGYGRGGAGMGWSILVEMEDWQI
jgi:hypothetical protein